jgi:CheY-like chemotaxis protein
MHIETKAPAGSLEAEVEALQTQVGLLGQVFNTRTSTGRRFVHINAARAQRANRVAAEKQSVLDLSRSDQEKSEHAAAQQRAVGYQILLPIVHKFDPEQAALRYRRKVAPKILVVDNNRWHGAAAVYTLRKRYLEVFFAANGRQALEVMEHESIDVVFSAAQMPVMDGAELADIIRYTEETAGARDFRTLVIAMVTPEEAATTPLMDDLFLAGMDRYLVKPLSTHLNSIADILSVDGASVEGFRRKALEQRWVSCHDELKVVLLGTEQERRKHDEVVSVHDKAVRREKEVLQFFAEDDKYSIEDLFARQRREDMARMQLNAARMRDRIRELELQLDAAQEANRRLTENKHASQLLTLERRNEELLVQLDHAKTSAAGLTEQNRTLSLDLKNLLTNGFANEKKVRAAERRSARLHNKMAQVEGRIMAMEDRTAQNHWQNYFGGVERRTSRFAPPAIAVDVASSWYAGLLKRLAAAASETSRECYGSVEAVEHMLRRAQLPSATLEGLRGDCVDTLREHIAHMDAITNTFERRMRDMTAQFLMRELQFWRYAQHDDPSLPVEIRAIVKTLDDRLREHLLNSADCQTDYADIPPIDYSDMVAGGGASSHASGTFALTTTGHAAESSPTEVWTVLPILERLAPLVASDEFVPTAVRKGSTEEALRLARAVEERRYTELLRAVQELRREAGHALEKVGADAQKEGVKLLPILSSIRPHTFPDVKAAILDICDHLGTIVDLALEHGGGGKSGRRQAGSSSTAGGGGGSNAASGRAGRVAAAAAAAKTALKEKAEKSNTLNKSGTAAAAGRTASKKADSGATGRTTGGGALGSKAKSTVKPGHRGGVVSPFSEGGGRGHGERRAAVKARTLRVVSSEKALKLIDEQLAKAKALLANVAQRSSDAAASGAPRTSGETEAFARAALVARATAAALEAVVHNTEHIAPVAIEGASVEGFTLADLLRLAHAPVAQLREANPDRELPTLASDLIHGADPIFLPITADLLVEAREEAHQNEPQRRPDSEASTASGFAVDDDGNSATLADVLDDQINRLRRLPSLLTHSPDPDFAEVPSSAFQRRGRSPTTPPSSVHGKNPSPTIPKTKPPTPASNPAQDVKINHQVVEPTTVGDIAKLFGVDASDIIKANSAFFAQTVGADGPIDETTELRQRCLSDEWRAQALLQR